MRPAVRLSLGATIAASMLLVATAASAAITSWSPVTSPDAGMLHNELHAVSAGGATVFAVGESYNGAADRTLVMRDVAGSWSLVSSPNNGTKHNALYGVSVLSATKAWAVGDYYTGHTDRTLALQWNGAKWAVQSSPSQGTRHNELDAVAAASGSNVWAVGSYFSGTADRTLIEHFNGSKWSIVKSPNVGARHNSLDAVAIVPGTHGAQAWAVGDYYNGVNDQTLVLHLSGGKWTVVKSPNSGTQANVLTGVVATSAGSAFAVGSYTEGHLGVTTHISQTLAEHWNGKAWSIMTTDNVGTLNNEFLAVAVRSASSVYAVGRYFDGSFDQTMVQHWNGSAWHVSTSGNANSNHNELEGAAMVAGSPGIAVGTYFNGSSDRTLVESCASCT